MYAANPSGPAGGVGCNGLGRWDGRAWHPVGDGLENGVTITVAVEPYVRPGTVNAICVAGTNVYVGGYFQAAGTTYANNIAYWDGAAWHALGEGVNNGVSWGSSPYGGQGVSAIAVYGTNVFVGGFFSLAGGQPALSVARWDGQQWHALAPGFDSDQYGNTGQVRGFAAGPDGLYMIGDFVSGGGGAVVFNYVARWDGTSLRSVGGGAGTDGVLAIAASGTNIYIGGGFGSVGGVAAAGGVAAWNGSSWAPFPGQFLLGGTNVSCSCGVYAMAFDGNDLYIGGLFAFNGTYSQQLTGTAKWTGTAWAIQPLSFDGYPTAMAVLGRSLYVQGEFQTIGSNLSLTAPAGFPTAGSKPSYGLARYSFVPYVSLAASVLPTTPASSATIQFTRTGPTDSPLTVNYGLQGTARGGVDYAALPGSITIPAGSSSASLAIQALAGLGAGRNATVALDLEDSATFTAGVPQTAVVALAPSLTLTASWQTGPSLHLLSQGVPNAVYILQAATTLAPPVNWLTIGTNAADGTGLWGFLDTGVSGVGARFYRLTTP